MEEEDLQNKNMILDIFYSTKGDIDKINAAIDAKLHLGKRSRSVTLFERYVKARLKRNPKALYLNNFEISPLEAVYLSQYPPLKELEILDLRQNYIGDEGLEAIAHSPLLINLREMDLRNNQITRLGMLALAKTTTLKGLEKLDLRANKLGKRWEEKLKESDGFPNLKNLRVG